MTELTNGTWVLVADGEKAMFLENVTDGQDPHLQVRRLEAQDNPRHGEQVSDRPGRRGDGGPRQSSAMEETDWHMLAKESFAVELSDILYRLAHRGAYDRLVIVAPPRTLGALRSHLHKEVSSKVVAEIDKDITNHPIRKIEENLKAKLAKM